MIREKNFYLVNALGQKVLSNCAHFIELNYNLRGPTTLKWYIDTDENRLHQSSTFYVRM